RDVEVVPEARCPTLACELRVLVLGKLEVGPASRRRERPRGRAAAVEFPDRAAAGQELRTRDATRGVRDERGDEDDDTENVEDPDDRQQPDHDLPPAV